MSGAGRRPVREIVRAGVVAVLLRPLASAATVAALAAMTMPIVAGVGLSRGVADQARAAIDAGADLYVSGERFGRPAPVPVATADTLRALPGVQSVEPRISGAVTLGDEPAVLVGVPPERLPREVASIDGRICAPGDVPELVLGSELAARLGLAPGDEVPPFYRNERGEKVSRVVGVFRSDLPAWQAHVVLATWDTAERVFAEEGTATALLVRCEAAYREPLRRQIARIASVGAPGGRALRPRVVSRDDLTALLARRSNEREGALAAVSLLAFAVGIPLLLATTGLGLSERRRETGLLKALGWRTDEVVLRGFAESLVLAALGTGAALAGVWVWVRLLGAAAIGPAFLPDADLVPGFDVPFRLVPEASVLAAAAAVVLASAGTLWASWRAASAPPSEAMR